MVQKLQQLKNYILFLLKWVLLGLFSLMCVICFAASGKGGLYSSQMLRFPKSNMKEPFAVSLEQG